MTFVDFLKSLAFDGETALFVKQVLKKRDGQIYYFPDGTPDSTYPAYLPDQARIREGDAWYGNTGCYILERFTDGKVSASAANCDYVLVMMLDDIGSLKDYGQLKIPPLEPTWKMETSEGSIQWGYAFNPDNQPTTNEFSAAINAIADALYTDKGAVNPVRNFRLPGSVNFKRGRNNFAAKLLEFHPDRLFSLDQICTALDVTPGEANTARGHHIRIKDTGGDNVTAWLNENNLILSSNNNEGWRSVICPNHAEHSEGLEGRYQSSTRSYFCFHGHCRDKIDSNYFLKWVADNGGPQEKQGLRSELLTDLGKKVRANIEPTAAFPDDAKARQTEADILTAKVEDRGKWFKEWAYVVTDDGYFNLVNRREVSRASFNAIFRGTKCVSIHTNRRIEASTYFDENREASGGELVNEITYAAGEKALVTRDGLIYGNKWIDARPEITHSTTSIDRWLKHCETLVPTDFEREHIFDMMAFKLQHPELKINHAVLHGGDEGAGKDLMWAPFIWSICGPFQRNYGLIKNELINNQWGYLLESEIVVLNELKEGEAVERRALANQLKPLIAAPPDLISINRKGLHPYYMLNRLFVLAFTNHRLPITLESSDRRWFCVWSTSPRMNSEDGAEMAAWYQKEGFNAIAGWLHDRDVSKFNPGMFPPLTDYKRSLIESGMSIAESYILDAINNQKHPFTRRVIGSPFHKICQELSKDDDAPFTKMKIPPAALFQALKEAKWIDCGSVGTKEHQTKKHMFCAPEMLDQFTKTELRNMLENTVKANVKTEDSNVIPIDKSVPKWM
jgi:hypothetical protein